MLFLFFFFFSKSLACQIYTHDDQIHLIPFSNSSCLYEPHIGTYPLQIQCNQHIQKLEYVFEHPIHLDLHFTWISHSRNPMEQTEPFPAFKILKSPKSCNQPYSFQIKWDITWDYYKYTSMLPLLGFLGLLLVLSFVFYKKITDIPFVFVEDTYTLEDNSMAWLKITNDVFNAPQAYNLFCGLVSTGIHCWLLFLGEIFINWIALKMHLKPTLNAFWPLVVSTAPFAGISNAYVYSTCNIQKDPPFKRKLFTNKLLLNCGVFPIVCYIGWKFCYKPTWNDQIFAFLLWIGVGIPCILIGNHLGHRTFRHRELQLYDQKQHLKYSKYWWIGGFLSILPFSILFFQWEILLSILYEQDLDILYTRGILLVLLVSSAVALVSLFQTYFRLQNQNYDWWWSSFWKGLCRNLYMESRNKE